MLGRKLATLVNEPKEVGRYAVRWDAAGLSSGVYFYQMTATSEKGKLFKNAKRMLLLK
jgi:hypothetical protein